MNTLKKTTLALFVAFLTAVALNACGNSNESANAAGSTWETIEKTGVLSVGTEGNYSPYTYHDSNGRLVGYDVELAEAIGEKLGLEVKFVEGKWDGLIAGLDAKQYDVIVNEVGISDERKEKYLFSEPYSYAYAVAVTRDDYDQIKSFEDLKDKDAAQSTTSNFGKLTESYGAKIVPVSGFSEGIQLVLDGRVDVTVNDNMTYLDFKKQQSDAKVKIAAQASEASESAVLIRKDDEELQENIDKALKELASEGKIAELSEKYFGEDISQPK